MLGRLKMTVDQCINKYTKLSEAIFQRQRLRLTLDGKVQGQFDHQTLERMIQECVAEADLGDGNDTLLWNLDKDACKVFVCAGSKEAGRATNFTSYEARLGLTDRLESTQIWEAARATSAATSFFKEIHVGRFNETFIDAAIFHVNNPIRVLWNEASYVWRDGGPLADQIECLISIGTGERLVVPVGDKFWNIVNTLKDIATDTDTIASGFKNEHMEDLVRTRKYFRFNVNQGLQQIGLEEYKRVPDIIACTTRYLEDDAQELLYHLGQAVSNTGTLHQMANYTMVALS